jgi:hypothetical protein
MQKKKLIITDWDLPEMKYFIVSILVSAFKQNRIEGPTRTD